MFSDRFLLLSYRITIGCLLLLAAGACRKASDGDVLRVALLPAENLSSDPSLDWHGRAMAVILTELMTGAPNVHPIRVERNDEARISRATHLLHSSFRLDNGQIHVRAFLEDLRRTRMVKTISLTRDLDQSPLGPAEALAGEIAEKVRPFGTRNREAIRHYSLAVSAGQGPEAVAAFERAIGADPAFALAHIGLVQILAAQGDRQRASALIEKAKSSAGSLDPIGKARMDLASAALNGDQASRFSAAASLARLAPADSDLARSLGEVAMQSRRPQGAVEWYRRAVQAEPSNGGLWNSLGYALAFTGARQEAVESLRKYEELAPREANPKDSLGEVRFRAGEFEAAERNFLEAFESNPAFLGGATLHKAAHSRLMSGDLEAAEKSFQRYLEIRSKAGDELADYRAAQWEYLTGRRRKAMSRLEKFQGSPDAAATALSQLAVWRLDTGSRASALEAATRAEALARSPAAKNLAALCRFVAGPEASSSQWAVRAETAFPQPEQAAVKKHALIYALLYSRQFAPAALHLKELLEQTHPFTAGHAKVLLAWALLESGKGQDAKALLDGYPIPQAGEPTFACLEFPRLFYLRGLLAQMEGSGDARSEFELFLKYSGDPADIFGEQAKARQALAR